ncbi:MAG: hypothetical protein ACR2OZ_02805 [Verrucomicrobiales bacterium]
MTLRTARKGSHAGQRFWGCSVYPGCTGTRAAETFAPSDRLQAEGFPAS